MATNIPPHNLGEVVDACLKLLAEPDTDIEELIDIVPGAGLPHRRPDLRPAGVREGYRTGRGRVIMRARTHFEDIGKTDRQAIIVDELPYQVNKRTLQERMAELVNEKKIEGISEIRDESDKSGMRLVIELKRGEMPEVVLNNLFKHTQLQDTFGMNMVALVDGKPRLLNLQADAGVLPRAPPRGRHPPHHLRAAQGARARPHPRRPGGGAVQRRRDHRADQGRAHAGRCQARADGARVALGAGRGDAVARARRQLPAGRAGSAVRPVRPRATACPSPGPGHPRTAPAAPDRPRAGQDRRRIPRGDGHHHRPARHPGPPRAHHRDHRRRARRDPQPVRRPASLRAGDEHRRDQHRGPDHARRHGRDPVAHRLLQAPAARRLPRPARGGRGKQATSR
jgi:hypothetical protein